MASSPRAPGRVAIDNERAGRGESPLLDEGHSSGLEERLMPRGDELRRSSSAPRARGIRRSSSPLPGPHAAGGARAFAHELFFVKADRRLYARPYLHAPGQILEAVLLSAIFVALGVSMADSFRSLDPVHEESHCWYQCCEPHLGRCSKDVCEKHHKEATNQTSPVDSHCAEALAYHTFRDDATWFLLALFTLEYLVRVWCCIEDPSLPSPRHPIRTRLAWMCKPMPAVDVLSLIPFYIDRIGVGTHVSPNFLRTIRLFRIFSVFRWERPLRAISVMGAVRPVLPALARPHTHMHALVHMHAHARPVFPTPARAHISRVCVCAHTHTHKKRSRDSKETTLNKAVVLSLSLSLSLSLTRDGKEKTLNTAVIKCGCLCGCMCGCMCSCMCGCMCSCMCARARVRACEWKCHKKREELGVTLCGTLLLCVHARTHARTRVCMCVHVCVR